MSFEKKNTAGTFKTYMQKEEQIEFVSYLKT